MTSSAILSHPIMPIADLPIDDGLATALVSSTVEHGEQLKGRRVWLACSGGRDSLALAALCVQLYRQDKLPFLPQLLHVDHGLQADSKVWAGHVARWAKVQNLPCHILPTQVQGYDEQAARQARYDVMRAHINQDDVLLLAHHADDQAETVLMRLIQGAGVNGLSGMQPWRIQDRDGHRNILWRPWLTVRRAQISAYAQRLKLPYIDDPTNDTGNNVRSGLRRDIMPVLATYNPNVVDNIARSAQLLSDAQVIINAQAEDDLQQAAVASLQQYPEQRVVNINTLQRLPLSRQRQLLHHWISQDEPLPPAKQLVNDALALSQRHDHDHQTQIFWQGVHRSYVIRRYREHMYRLSTQWLNWLKLPLNIQSQRLDMVAETSVNSSSDDNQCISFILRSSVELVWQAQIMPNALTRVLKHQSYNHNHNHSHKNEIEIRFAPLRRLQRVQTAMASRPQAGKKLYQTLGVPVWLRDSLVVVSATFVGKDDIASGDMASMESKLATNERAVELPILLLSPFDSWVLGTDTLNRAIEEEQLTKLINSCLRPSNALYVI